MKDKKIEYIKSISAITINDLMPDHARGNFYRGRVSDNLLDEYIKTIKSKLAEAEKLLSE